MSSGGKLVGTAVFESNPEKPMQLFIAPFESIYTPRNTPKYLGTIIPARPRSCPASAASRITRLISPW